MSPKHSACLDFSCNAQSLVVVTLVGQVSVVACAPVMAAVHDWGAHSLVQNGQNTLVTCPAEGGDVVFPSGSQFLGSITCPPKTLLCTGNPCDNQFCGGHGVCNPANGQCTCNQRCGSYPLLFSATF